VTGNQTGCNHLLLSLLCNLLFFKICLG
jgi:hypothetical protein